LKGPVKPIFMNLPNFPINCQSMMKPYTLVYVHFFHTVEHQVTRSLGGNQNYRHVQYQSNWITKFVTSTLAGHFWALTLGYLGTLVSRLGLWTHLRAWPRPTLTTERLTPAGRSSSPMIPVWGSRAYA